MVYSNGRFFRTSDLANCAINTETRSAERLSLRRSTLSDFNARQRKEMVSLNGDNNAINVTTVAEAISIIPVS